MTLATGSGEVKARRQRRSARGARTIVAGVALLLLPRAASANPFDLYGSGPAPMAMAGAYVAHAGDVHSVFYNPAGLAFLRQFELAVGTVFAAPTLSLKVGGRDFSGDYVSIDRTKTPPVVALAPDGVSDVDFTAQHVDRAAGFVFGVGGPLGTRDSFLGRIAFGALFYQPYSQILRERFGRAQDPFFLDYEDRGLRMMIVLALAAEIVRDKLSLGIALNILADSDAALETVPTPSTRIDLVGRVAVNAGVYYRPLPRLGLGFCFRDKLSLTAHTEIRPFAAQQGLDIEVINPLSRNPDITVQTLFSPRVYALGAALDLTRTLAVTVELNVVDWTSYVPPFAPPMEIHQVGAPQNQCVAVNNECIRNQPKEVAAIQSTRVKLSPTFIPRVAASWRTPWRFHLRGGYAFLPTPVPDQTSITSILDAHKHVIGFGGGYAHAFGKNRLTVELGGQVQLLQARRWRKDPADPTIETFARAASGVDRDPRFAPNPLAPEFPRSIPEVEISGAAYVLALSLAYDYTL